MTDTRHTIIRSAAQFFSGTMMSRITGLLRDMSLAYAFGTESAVAALLVAFRFAHLLRRLLGEGAMQTALIPYFEELRAVSKQRAARFFCDLALSLTLLLTIFISIVMAALWGLLTLNLFSPGNAEIIWLTFLMMPSLLFICLFGVNASLLQCEKKYFISSAAPVIFNLFWILGIFFSSHLAPSDAMMNLSFYIILACMAQWAVTLPKTYQIIVDNGVSLFFKVRNCFSFDVRNLAKPLILGIVGVAASQINNALDSVFARWADEEGPALLWYAIRLQQLPLALFGIALSGALLPPLARAIKANDLSRFQHFLDFAVRRTLLLMIPITIALFIFGDSCVAFIYGHGDFTDTSIVGTTQSLWGYTLGLVPMCLILVLAPAFYAKGDYRTPSIAAVGSMVINILLNSLFVAKFGWGAASIALATSISAWCNLFWLGIMLNKLVSGTTFNDDSKVNSKGISWETFQWYREAIKLTFISLTAGAAAILVDSSLRGEFTPFLILNGITPDYSSPFIAQASHLVVNGLVFLGGLVVMLTAKRFMIGWLIRTPSR